MIIGVFPFVIDWPSAVTFRNLWASFFASIILPGLSPLRQKMILPNNPSLTSVNPLLSFFIIFRIEGSTFKAPALCKKAASPFENLSELTDLFFLEFL